MIERLKHNALSAQVSISPLVTFRFLFGAIMFISMVRFYLNGWIEAQYIEPTFHFKYFGLLLVPGTGFRLVCFFFPSPSSS